MTDEAFMSEALTLAKEAAAAGDVPVGAVVVRDGVIIGRGRNRRESGGGATAHAEIEAINQACAALGGWRLNGCGIYVTLEPCPMCAGAIFNARLDYVVFGASERTTGAMGGLFDLFSLPLEHKPEVREQVMAAEAGALLEAFFAARRQAVHPKRLGRDFYSGHADTVAPALLGKLLCRRDPATGEVIRDRITETECYLGTADTACHAAKGITDRNRVMWDKGGTVYVYLCYGIHNMLNLVTGAKGEPEAVLIRGTEHFPGPGILTKGFGIDRKLNASDAVLSADIWVEDDATPAPAYDCLTRVGIDYASEEDRLRLWRYSVKK